MDALIRALERYQAGSGSAREVWSALEAVLADGRTRRPGDALQLLGEAADEAGLSPVSRGALERALEARAGGPPGTDADATRVEAADDRATRIAAPEADDDGATRIAAAPADPTATRVAPGPGSAGPAASGEAPGEPSGPRRGHTATGATSSDWAHPEQWERVHEGPLGPGSVIKQRFVLEELIGQGGMGSVYRARDLRKEEAEDSDPFVALKLLSEEFRRHPDALVSLQREAKKAQTLAHPNIVTVYDFDRDGDQVYMTMEFLRGDPLDRLISGRGRMGLAPKEAFRIVDRMARGLAYAHQEGFVHADFKPGNVFLTTDGHVRILDFGIARAAKVAGEGRGDDTRFDPASLGAITPSYASAEMLAGEAAEPADDVYALACVAYELLSGRHPFRDEAGRKLPADEAARRGLRPEPIRGLPRRWSRAIQRGLAFQRSRRFPDAGRFIDAIKRPEKVRRRLTVAVAALALAAVVSWWVTIRESDVLVTLADLPPSLESSVELVRQGDRYLDQGEPAQAHKVYAQAWESADGLTELAPRDRSRLRRIVDGRVDRVIGHYLDLAERPDADPFALEVLRLTLESLERHDLGTRDEELQDVLAELNQRIAQAR